MSSRRLTEEQRSDAERLRAVIQERRDVDPGLTQIKLSQLCGWSPSTTNQYLSAAIALNPRAVAKFALALGVPAQRISPVLARELLMQSRSLEDGAVAIRRPREPRFGPLRGIPLVSHVQAGAWSEVQDSYEVGDAERWFPALGSEGKRAFALRVRGVSMESPGAESFPEGTIIFIDPDMEPRHRSFVVAKLPDTQEATFKQLIIENGRRYLRALNPAWPNPLLEIDDDTQIIGVMYFSGRFY